VKEEARMSSTQKKLELIFKFKLKRTDKDVTLGTGLAFYNELLKGIIV